MRRSDSAYVTGVLFPWSLDAPDGTPLAPPGGFVTYPFVAKLNPAGSAFAYLSHYGSPGDWWEAIGTAVAVDTAGTAYVTGSNLSTVPFPTTPGAFQTQNAGVNDAFIWRPLQVRHERRAR